MLLRFFLGAHVAYSMGTVRDSEQIPAGSFTLTFGMTVGGLYEEETEDEVSFFLKSMIWEGCYDDGYIPLGTRILIA